MNDLMMLNDEMMLDDGICRGGKNVEFVNGNWWVEMGNIEVVNVKKLEIGSFEYIGRVNKWKGLDESILRNRCGGESKEERIENYRLWLWGKIKSRDEVVMNELYRLIAMVMSGKEVKLGCWCKRDNEEVGCHGDVVKRCLAWMIREAV